MSSKSKNKGSGFEREVSKYLSDLYGENFMRAPGSGAYTGGTNAHRKQILHEGQIRNFKGDIIPGQSFPLFNAECKFYADFQFHQLFDESKQLESWIEQLMVASDPDDLNILLMKFNRKGRYVAVQAKHKWFGGHNFSVYDTKAYGVWMICTLESFFAHNKEKVKYLSSNQKITQTPCESEMEALHLITHLT